MESIEDVIPFAPRLVLSWRALINIFNIHIILALLLSDIHHALILTHPWSPWCIHLYNLWCVLASFLWKASFSSPLVLFYNFVGGGLSLSCKSGQRFIWSNLPRLFTLVLALFERALLFTPAVSVNSFRMRVTTNLSSIYLVLPFINEWFTEF